MIAPLRWAVIPIFLLLSLLLYYPVLDGDWVFDDVRLVSTNDWLWRSFEGVSAELQEWWRVSTTADPATDQVRVGFRPLRFISYRLDALATMAMGIDDPAQDGATTFFHLHNILLHGLCASLLFLLVQRIHPAGNGVSAALMAGLFLVHPVQSEAVAWISGRRDVLFCGFYLGALLLMVSGKPGWGRGLAVALLAALSMASKEMAATLPAAMVAVALVAQDGPRTRKEWLSWSRVAIPTLLVLGLLSIRLLAVQDPGAGAPHWGGSVASSAWTVGRAVMHYLALFTWPIGLSVDYSYAAIPASTGALSPVTSLLSWIAIVGGLLLSWNWLRGGRYSAAIVWPLFLALLSPVLQIFPHPERFAERFLYLPMVALAIPLVYMLASLERRSPGSRLPVLLILLCLSALITRERLSDWQGPYPLWSSAVTAQPQCARAWFGLAEAARGRQWNSEAASDLGKSIDILAPISRDRLQQGIYLQSLQIRAGLLAGFGGEGNLREAYRHLQELLEESDTDGTAVRNQSAPWREYLKVCERLGEYEGAREAALELVNLPATQPALRFEAMLYLSATSDGDDRQRYFQQARDLAVPIGDRAISKVSYQQGMVALEEKQFAEAREFFDEALRTLDEEGRRSSARYRKAEAWLGLGDTARARQTLEELLGEDPQHLPAHLSLGELLLSTDQVELALEHFRTVLEVVPDNPQALQGIRQAAVRKKLEEGTAEAFTDPTRITALTMLADRMLGKGEPAKAREALVEACKHAEGPVEKDRRIDLLLRIARHDAQQGDWALALDGYQHLLELAEISRQGDFILEAGEVFRRVEGATAALEMLESRRQAGVSEPRLLRQMGAMAHGEGQLADAANWYRKYLEEATEEDPQVRSRVEEALEAVEKILSEEAADGEESP